MAREQSDRKNRTGDKPGVEPAARWGADRSRPRCRSGGRRPADRIGSCGSPQIPKCWPMFQAHDDGETLRNPHRPRTPSSKTTSALPDSRSGRNTRPPSAGAGQSPRRESNLVCENHFSPRFQHGPGDLGTERFAQHPAFADLVRGQRVRDGRCILAQRPVSGLRVPQFHKADATTPRRNRRIDPSTPSSFSLSSIGWRRGQGRGGSFCTRHVTMFWRLPQQLCAKAAHQGPVPVQTGQINQSRLAGVAMYANLNWITHSSLKAVFPTRDDSPCPCPAWESLSRISPLAAHRYSAGPWPE